MSLPFDYSFRQDWQQMLHHNGTRCGLHSLDPAAAFPETRGDIWQTTVPAFSTTLAANAFAML
jgi:hypothetical protein